MLAGGGVLYTVNYGMLGGGMLGTQDVVGCFYNECVMVFTVIIYESVMRAGLPVLRHHSGGEGLYAHQQVIYTAAGRR